MGKCFSGVNQGQRHKSDFYQTPFSITEQLLENEKFDYKKTILEPACGNGAIQRILSRKFSGVFCYDIERTFYYQKDFLTEEEVYNYIITNPPFSLSTEFILKAKEIVKEKFAFLLPLSYLHGQFRLVNIYQDKEFRLARVYVFSRYPLLEETIREDGKYQTGMMAYAWYVWDRDHKGNPEIRWIDNNQYVIGSKKIEKECEQDLFNQKEVS